MINTIVLQQNLSNVDTNNENSEIVTNNSAIVYSSYISRCEIH